MIRPPLISTSGTDWSRLAIERFQVPFHSLNLGPSSTHRLTLHLGGPVEIARQRDGHEDRKWSDRGSSNLIPVGEPTIRSFNGEADFMIAYLAPSLVDEVMAEIFDRDSTCLHLCETLAVHDATADQLSRLLLNQVAVTKPGQRLLNDTLGRALVLHLIRAYGGTALPNPLADGKLAPWRVSRVVDYMHANLADQASLTQLASLVGLGPIHFTRAFRAATGFAPHAYLLRLRIAQAARLLEMTDLLITEVGVRCGFDHPSHFTATFRKRMGLSPRAYRNSRR